MAENKKPSLIGNRNKNHYQETPKPEQPYNGINEIPKDILANERGTIRVPLDQKIEFDALLMTSDYSYSYELMAELVYESVKNKSKEENKKYQETLAMLRDKELKRIERKKMKK
ncbi:hypothetical protein A5881_003953 [Enterococcus termitis]